MSKKFLILDCPLAVADMERRLGIFTLDYNSPLARFAPDDPSETIKPYLKTPVVEGATFVAAKISNRSKFEAALEPFFKANFGSNTNASTMISACKIETFDVSNIDKVLQMAAKTHGADIHAMLDRVGSKLNMLPEKMHIATGYKLPVELAVNAVVPAAIPPDTKLALGGQNNVQGNLTTTSKLKGRVCFAVLYWTIGRHELVARLEKSSVGSVYMKQEKLFDFGRGMGIDDNAHEDKGEDIDGPNELKLDYDDWDKWEILDEQGEEFLVRTMLLPRGADKIDEGATRDDARAVV